jgi:hypothetical protein
MGRRISDAQIVRAHPFASARERRNGPKLKLSVCVEGQPERPDIFRPARPACEEEEEEISIPLE